MTDMHIHSNYSDGTDSVEKIYNITKDYDLFSITDHNNISASKILQANNHVPGVELSVNGMEFGLYDVPELHFVAYDYDPFNRKLNELIDQFIYYNNLIYYNILVSIVLKFGLIIDFSLINELLYKKVTLNKVHITRILMESGYGNDLYITYNMYVKEFLNTKQYYLRFNELLDAIKRCGGYILLAHPYEYGLNNQLEELIRNIAKAGVDGIEMDLQHYEELMKYVKKYNFVYAVGSDYHGKDYRKCTNIGIDDDIYSDDDNYLKNILLTKHSH